MRSAREKTFQGEQKEVITLSSITTMEAGRNSRESIQCLRDAGIKESKREETFSELERSVNCQAVIFLCGTKKFHASKVTKTT